MNKIEALNEKALEAAVLAHDKEEAAMRGEPDPWVDERPEDEFADRKAAMAEAIRAYLTASDAKREPVAWMYEKGGEQSLQFSRQDHLTRSSCGWIERPLYAAPLPLTDLEAEDARLKARVAEALEALDEIAGEIPGPWDEKFQRVQQIARRAREGGKVDG